MNHEPPEFKLMRQAHAAPVTNADLTCILDILAQLHGKLDILTQSVEGLSSRVDDTVHKLDAHMVGEEAVFKGILAGFPDGNPEKHAQAHVDEAEAAKVRKDFWNKMLFEVTKYGLIGFVGWLAFTLWGAFLKGPK